MAADNEAPVASNASNSRPSEGSGKGNADGGASSKNESGKDGFRRNPRHDHRTRGKGRSEKGRGEWRYVFSLHIFDGSHVPMGLTRC